MGPKGRCLNCGGEGEGAFCADCGQDRRLGRLDLRQVLTEAMSHLLDLDGRIPATVIGLTRSPGRLCRAYVDGQRVRFVSPLKYCLTAVALALLAIAVVGIEQMIPEVAGGGELSDLQLRVRGMVVANLNLIILLALPVYALLIRWLFRGSGANLAEVLAFALFTSGHLFLVGAVLTIMPGITAELRMGLRLAVHAVYLSWAAVVFFDTSVVAGTLRMLVATAGYMVAVTVMAVVVAVPLVLLAAPP